MRRVVLVVAVGTGLLAVPDLAHADEPQAYVVLPGDSLYGIAAKTGSRVSDLLRVNGLQLTSVIVPGQRLELPDGATSGSSGGSSAAGGSSSSVGGSTSATAASSGVTHVVRWGDTLSGIAGRYRVPLSSLLTANKLTTTSLIMPGMRLNVPGGTAPSGSSSGSSSAGSSSGAASAPASGAASGAASAGSSGVTHVVRWGDTLSGIAGRYRVPLSSLLTANKLTTTSLIMPGMRLNVPGGTAPSGSSSGAPSTGSTSSGSAPGGSTGQALTGIAKVVSYARAQEGKPYRFFTKGPDTFDCSGLTLAAYAQVGVKLVHYSAYQAKQGTAVDFHNEPIRAGDLIFQKRRGSDTINHVGMAISSTTWIQAVGGSTPVRVGSLPHENTIAAVRRYLDN